MKKADREKGHDQVSREPAMLSCRLNPEAEEFCPKNEESKMQAKSLCEPKRLRGHVDGLAVDFLCDTGAESTVINKKLLECMPRATRMKFLDSSSHLVMTDGTRSAAYGPVLCELEAGGRIISELVFAADIRENAILGWDAQMAIGVIYTVAGVDLTTGRQIRRVNNPNVRRVRVAERCVVPARSEALVPSRWDSEKGMDARMISGWLNPAENRGLAVARTIIAGKNQQGPVRIVNMADEPRVLEIGEVIAGIEEVDDPCEAAMPITPSKELPAHLKDLHCKVMKDAKLSPKVAQEFAELLMKHHAVFAAHDKDLGRTDLVKHHIDTGDARPIRQPPRRLPISQQADCEKEVQEMQSKGVIEQGQSPWSSPVVLVRKKDGSLRFCVDYRKLNAVTKFDAFPLPRIDETLDALSGAKWFTTLDLLAGYWQVGLTPEAKLKSAFSTRSGLYLWNVMPFGLCNAPSTFERLMEGILHGLHWQTCLVYLDDIVIFGRSEAELLERTDQVLQKLGQAGLKVKPHKCSFFARETNYLGHIVCADGVKVCPEKVAAVKDWPAPQCVTEMRSFLGTANYYRRFVAGYASIAAPLCALTKKNAPFKWTNECQAAFQRLKDELISAPVLAFPVPGAKFVLDTDASGNGIGAVLSQLIPAGKNSRGEPVYDEKVLGYASRTLNDSERNYCVTRKEMLAVVWYVRYFRPYLYGREFVVRTDHACLQWLYNFWEPEGQIARWLQILGEYQFKVEHRQGTRHGNADGLSRMGPCKSCKQLVDADGNTTPGPAMMCPEKVAPTNLRKKIPVTEVGQRSECNRNSTLPTTRKDVTINAVTVEPEWTTNQLAVWQEADEELQPVVLAKRKGQKPPPELIAGWPAATKRLMLEWDRLQVVQGVLFREWYNKNGRVECYQLVTPQHIKAQILTVAHDGETAGHYGDRKTAKKVRKLFYWPRLLTDVRDYCRSCVTCQRRKSHPKRPSHPLQQDAIGEPMQKITLDLLGFDHATERGNRYLLVVVDSLTKWVEAVPLQDERAETVAQALVEHIVCRLGFPAQLHSDQGRQFEAEIFQHMCELLGINKTRTTPYRPESDGQTERANRSIIDLLAKSAINAPEDWDLRVPFVLAAYRSTPHSTTGETPNRLMLGREVVTPLQLMTPPVPDQRERHPWVETLKDNFEKAHADVQEHIGCAQRAQKQQYDKKTRNVLLEENQLVWLWSTRKIKAGPRKLNAARWEGPYEIKKRISPAVYVIAKQGERATRVVSAAHLMPCISRPLHLRVENDQIEALDQHDVQQPLDSDVDDVAAQSEEIDDEFNVIQAEQIADQVTVRPQRARRQPAWLADGSFEL